MVKSNPHKNEGITKNTNPTQNEENSLNRQNQNNTTQDTRRETRSPNISRHNSINLGNTPVDESRNATNPAVTHNLNQDTSSYIDDESKSENKVITPKKTKYDKYHNPFQQRRSSSNPLTPDSTRDMQKQISIDITPKTTENPQFDVSVDVNVMEGHRNEANVVTMKGVKEKGTLKRKRDSLSDHPSENVDHPIHTRYNSPSKTDRKSKVSLTNINSSTVMPQLLNSSQTYDIPSDYNHLIPTTTTSTSTSSTFSSLPTPAISNDLEPTHTTLPGESILKKSPAKSPKFNPFQQARFHTPEKQKKSPQKANHKLHYEIFENLDEPVISASQDTTLSFDVDKERNPALIYANSPHIKKNCDESFVYTFPGHFRPEDEDEDYDEDSGSNSSSDVYTPPYYKSDPLEQSNRPRRSMVTRGMENSYNTKFLTPIRKSSKMDTSSPDISTPGHKRGITWDSCLLRIKTIPSVDSESFMNDIDLKDKLSQQSPEEVLYYPEQLRPGESYIDQGDLSYDVLQEINSDSEDESTTGTSTVHGIAFEDEYDDPFQEIDISDRVITKRQRIIASSTVVRNIFVSRVAHLPLDDLIYAHPRYMKGVEECKYIMTELGINTVIGLAHWKWFKLALKIFTLSHTEQLYDSNELSRSEIKQYLRDVRFVRSQIDDNLGDKDMSELIDYPCTIFLHLPGRIAGIIERDLGDTSIEELASDIIFLSASTAYHEWRKTTDAPLKYVDEKAKSLAEKNAGKYN